MKLLADMAASYIETFRLDTSAKQAGGTRRSAWQEGEGFGGHGAG